MGLQSVLCQFQLLLQNGLWSGRGLKTSSAIRDVFNFAHSPKMSSMQDGGIPSGFHVRQGAEDTSMALQNMLDFAHPPKMSSMHYK